MEISNNSKYEADLSKWAIASDVQYYILPDNTLILPGKKITLSPRMTGLNISDKASLKLFFPNRQLAYDYGNMLAEQAVETSKSSESSKLSEESLTAQAGKSRKSIKIGNEKNEILKTDEIIDSNIEVTNADITEESKVSIQEEIETENLKATAINALPESKDRNFTYFGGLALLIVLAVVSVVWFRRFSNIADGDGQSISLNNKAKNKILERKESADDYEILDG